MSASAGQNIAVSWGVTNIGAAAAPGPWRESVYLVPAALTLAQFNTNLAAFSLVGAFTFTNGLAAGAGVIRTQQVAIPPTGAAGDLRAAVFVDSDNGVIEQAKANNTGLAANDLQVPLSLSLVLPVTNVLESTPTPALASLVSRNGDLSAPLRSPAGEFLDQQSHGACECHHPGGRSLLPFTATVLDDGVLGPNTLVTVSASVGGYLAATSQVTVVNTDVSGLDARSRLLPNHAGTKCGRAGRHYHGREREIRDGGYQSQFQRGGGAGRSGFCRDSRKRSLRRVQYFGGSKQHYCPGAGLHHQRLSPRLRRHGDQRHGAEQQRAHTDSFAGPDEHQRAGRRFRGGSMVHPGAHK